MRLTTLFSLILGLLIGVCATMALHVDQPGPDAGDWLAFAGALVGVVFTIVGTLWLEHYRATANAREDRLMLLRTLKEMQEALTAAAEPRGQAPIGEARASRIEGQQRLLKALSKFVFARHYVPKRNLEAWQAIEELNESIVRWRPKLENYLQSIEEAGDSEGMLADNIDSMREVQQRLGDKLAAARAMVKAHQV